MPVTARLSKAFYAKFGDEATNELVNWLNAVDETYRGDLRELNELNFARFEAKLGERLAELDARWTERWTKLEGKTERLGATLELRLAQQGEKFSASLRGAEIRLAALTIAWVPLALAIFEFVFRR